MSKNTTNDLHVYVRPFDLDQIGYHSDASIGIEVHGYWSDVITIYVRRETDWTKDPLGGQVNWKFEVTHSSGGRDTDEVKDDVLANEYFAAGLMAACLEARKMRAQVDRFEANYQRLLPKAKVEYEAEQAAKAAVAAADPAMGDLQAITMIAQLAELARPKGTAYQYRKHGYRDATILAYARGAKDRPLHISATKGNNGTVYYRQDGSRTSRAQAIIVNTVSGIIGM